MVSQVQPVMRFDGFPNKVKKKMCGPCISYEIFKSMIDTSTILIIAKRLGCLNLYFTVFTKLVFHSSTPVVRRDKSNL